MNKLCWAFKDEIGSNIVFIPLPYTIATLFDENPLFFLVSESSLSGTRKVLVRAPNLHIPQPSTYNSDVILLFFDVVDRSRKLNLILEKQNTWRAYHENQKYFSARKPNSRSY